MMRLIPISLPRPADDFVRMPMFEECHSRLARRLMNA